MAALDPHVAKVVDRNRATDSSDDEDALIAELEDDNHDPSLDALREKRLEQLHAEISRAKSLKETPGHGTYQEIKDEKQLMDITTSTSRCIVHFMKPDFARCRTMDARLEVLAERHFEVRFLSINVENAPFLVVKLGIQVLPVVVCFKDAVGVDRVVGFEGVGRREDEITVAELEGRLLGSGVLVRGKVAAGGDNSRKKEVKEAEEVWDDDEWE